MRNANRKVIVAVVLGALQGGCALGVAWLLKTVVDIILGDNAQLEFSTFCIIGIVYFGIYMLIYYGCKKSFFAALRDIRTRIKRRIFSGLLWEAEESHQKRKAGEVLAMFQHQLDMLESDYYEPMLSLVQNVATVVVAVSSLLILQWNAALFCALLLVVYFLLTYRIKKRLELLKRKKVQANTLENNELVTMVNAYHTAKDTKQEPYFLRRFGSCVEQYEDLSCSVNMNYNILAMIGANLQPMITLLILLFGSLLLARGSINITVGGLLALIEMVAALVGPIGTVGTLSGQMKSTKAIRQGFDACANAGKRGKTEWLPSKDLPRLKKLTLQNISFSYDGLKVFDRVSIELLAGKKYAIVGKSGSGKTTLLKILLKQRKPQAGRIQWNGVPYEDIHKADLYRKIGYVAQSPVIFHSSIRDNILVGGWGKDEKRLCEAVKQSQVNVVHGGNHSMEEVLSLSALELSNGEKKRVAFARSLYKDCEVLVLDEFTSAVSTQMARQMEKEILQRKDLTVLHVTHTLSEDTAALYDTVFHVEDMRVMVKPGD